ncbi:hypothetical protein C9374_008137 [Naegleria lovaniensis]|uniref:Uncharacterized protein n=1 Tax=Naegleria lovaniensis TaxID=51637 RepID=A0AA88GH88_NAELO|nr:uncharacterized protein C9374_008137 [Naegleria lovaniensis]KAG2378498.1 hypothetical protein C9374_008137 [Naegleria lovaniensis]
MFTPFDCVQIDLTQVNNILIPIPDIRHLHRNLVNQLLSPKRLNITGVHPCCFFDITQLQNSYSIANFQDKQNQGRADFSISEKLLSELRKNEDAIRLVHMLDAIRDIVESIRNTELSHFERPRRVVSGGFFILLQYNNTTLQLLTKSHF